MLYRVYVDVLLPIPLDQPIYSYVFEDDRPWTPEDLVGHLVLVPLGQSRLLTGVVWRVVGTEPPKPDIRYKRVLSLLPYPQIPTTVLRLWGWVAEYYMSGIGEVMQQAVVAPIRIDGEVKYSFVDTDRIENDELAHFAQRHSTFKIQQLRSEYPERYLEILTVWLSEGIVDEVSMVGSHARGTEWVWYVDVQRLEDELWLKEAEQQLARSHKTIQVIRDLADKVDTAAQHHHSAMAQSTTVDGRALHFASLKAIQEEWGIGAHIVAKLKDIGLLIRKRLISATGRGVQSSRQLPPLREEYRTRSYTVENEGRECPIVLHHQPFAAPEDRLPIAKMYDVVARGGQVLLLLPSHALLDHLLPQLSDAFGGLLAPYHTGISTSAKGKFWSSALRGEATLYVGLRSAVWLPLSRLAMVVVMDEEDKGYRQFEPFPHYTASRVAMVLAQYSGASLYLASCTPSIEARLRSIEGMYAYHYDERGSSTTYSYEAVSLSKSFERNKIRARLLSFELYATVVEAVERGEVALLFYQRRGFAKQLECMSCHHTPTCPVCQTTMRWMLEAGRMVCPVCGHYEVTPHQCPKCGTGELKPVGTGVERLVAALRPLLEHASVHILEEMTPLEITSAIHRGGVIVSTAYEPPYQILEQVSVIGFVQIDLMTMIPDFRANERAYRMLQKCANASPRLKALVVQYLAQSKPNALVAFEQRDYSILLDHELEARHIVLFPPFARQIDIIVNSTDQRSAYRVTDQLVRQLRIDLESISILGPTPLPASRKNTEIGYRIAMLIPLSADLDRVRSVARVTVQQYVAQYSGPKIYVSFDVDPI